MAVTTPDALFKPFADRLLGCWCAQLASLPTAANRPARCSFRFDDSIPSMGIALHEDECKCGTAWVRVADWFITSDAAWPGPDNSLEAQNCPRLWGLVLELGIGRCPPIGTEKDLPTPAQLNAFHDVLLDDLKAMRQAIYCCFLTVDPMDRIALETPQRVGPNGACLQQSLQLTIMVTACDEC